MKTLSCMLLAAFAPAALSPAQIMPWVSAGSDIVATACSSTKSLPKGTVLVGTSTLSLVDPSSGSSVTTSIADKQPNALSVTATCIGGMGCPAVLGNVPGYIGNGPAVVLWTLRGHGQGVLVVNASIFVKSYGFFGGGSIGIDIDNDGSLEFTMAQSTSLTIPLAVSGERKVAFQIYAAAEWSSFSGSGYTQLVLDATFLQTNTQAAFSQYGSSCGPTLTGMGSATLAHHDLWWDVTGAFPNQPVVLILGTMRTSTPIMGCTLYTAPILGIGLVSDFTGYATWSARLPKPVIGTIRSQAFPLDPATSRLTASAGLEIVFAD